MAISDIEAHSASTDFRLRKYLKELLTLKKYINEELSNENISPKRESDLEASKYTIEQNIQKIRFSGIL